jgi:LysR family transcriptional activator of nhaA
MLAFSNYASSTMEWLNYHHLLYFWLVAREGGLAPAGKILRLAHPTLSGQIHALEAGLGEKLFERAGRRLALTDVGRVVYRYADDIFNLGQEMLDTVRGRPTGQPVRLAVGIADVVPKLVVAEMLAPALRLPEPVRLACHEDNQARLLARLALHELDVILAEAPVPPGAAVRAYNHLLGECGVSWYGARRFAGLRRGFPASLDGAPVLLPLEGTALRRSLEQWFDAAGVRPRLVAELEDSALIMVLGAQGLGLFPAPSAVDRQVREQYRVGRLGRADGVVERFYAVSIERKIKNPAVVAICDAARSDLFAGRALGR